MRRPSEPLSEEPLSFSIRSSREAALRVLDEHRITGMWVSDLLDRVFRESGLPAAEKGLATELSCGIVRRQATLDAVLKKLVARPVDQVEAALWSILRIGIYQIMLLDGIPLHAAVHETVDLCKRIGQMRWCGFVNGVLRAATRMRSDQIETSPSSSAIPLGGGRHRVLLKPVFADPKSQFTAYVAGAYSFPGWLVERWMQRFSKEQILELCDWFNSPPLLVIRANELKSTKEKLVAALSDAGVTFELVGNDSIVIRSSVRVDKLPGYEDGQFVVQDYSATQAAIRLSAKPGHRVWDVCAAPGGKTCHIAAMMNNEGQVVATDVRSDRLETVNQNAKRLGASIIRTQLVDEEGRRMPDGPFDAILVDVPCSNTGVLAKRPEARWRITPEGMRELARVQSQLLGKSLERLAVGGRLVYSTCSIEPSENEEIVRQVLKSFPGVELVEETNFIPGQPADGAYQALLIRKS